MTPELLENFRLEIRDLAAEALDQCRLNPNDRYWVGRADAFALALTLLDNAENP